MVYRILNTSVHCPSIYIPGFGANKIMSSLMEKCRYPSPGLFCSEVDPWAGRIVPGLYETIAPSNSALYLNYFRVN